MGRILGWGYNNAGQTKNVDMDDIVDVVGGSDHSVALRSNSSVMAWGGDMFTDVPEAALSNVRSIAAGWYHSLALRYDGTVVGWGDRAVIPQNVPRFEKIAAGEMFSVGVTAEGNLVVWGPRAPILPDIMKTNVKEVVASKTNIMILKEGGFVAVCDRVGELSKTVPFNAHGDVKKMAMGRNRFFVLKQDGSVVFWGDKLRGMLDHELASGVIDISAGDDFVILLKSGGLVVMGEEWGGQLKIPEVDRNEKIVKIVAGNHHGFLLVEPK